MFICLCSICIVFTYDFWRWVPSMNPLPKIVSWHRQKVKSGWRTHAKVQQALDRCEYHCYFFGDVFNSISGAPRISSKTHEIVGLGCVRDSIEQINLSPLMVRPGIDHLTRFRLLFFSFSLELLSIQGLSNANLMFTCFVPSYSNISKLIVSHVQADLKWRDESSVAHPRGKTFLCGGSWAKWLVPLLSYHVLNLISRISKMVHFW